MSNLVTGGGVFEAKGISVKETKKIINEGMFSTDKKLIVEVSSYNKRIDKPESEQEKDFIVELVYNYENGKFTLDKDSQENYIKAMRNYP